MTAVTASVEVGRPARAVFDYATDPSRFHEWQQGIVEGELGVAGSKVQPGDQCTTTRKIGLATRAITSEVVAVDPPRTWRIRGIEGPIRAEVDVLVEELAAERSRVTITVDFEGRGVGRVLVPLVIVRQARNEMPANVKRLRDRLEQPGT